VKPEPAIYQAALAKIGCRPEQCFYTDDIADYVQAGRSFGLDAEVFATTTELESQLSDRGVVL
jgi:putative hydrolase of the HAD superfamily